MFIKDGKDYIYVCKQRILNKDEEVEIFSNNLIKVFSYPTEDKKSAEYYRIVTLKKLNISMLPKTLVIVIPKSKLKYKILLNLTADNIILVQSSFKGNSNSYIAFGKTCTEENI